MFTRKSLFVALTVIAMLAMLVPVAFAAPELVASVTINNPTTGTVAYIDPPANLTIDYTIVVTGQQVNDVLVTFRLIPENGPAIVRTVTVPANQLHTGANLLHFTFDVPANAAEGFYHLEICIDDGVDPYCTTQPRSVFLRNNLPPTVTLERPFDNAACTWVTGNQYELFGMATDDWAVKSAWFEFTMTVDANGLPVNNSGIKIGNENAGVGKNATPVAGFPGEFSALWDSSLVPDGTGYIRFCATDSDNVTVCTGWVDVCVENRVKVPLQKGWNLISSPLVLYNGNVADVLSHVWNPLTNTPWATAPIDKIYTTRNGVDWTYWMNGAPDGVGQIQDGYGYWVHAVAPATIEFIGTWLSIGPVAPPEYPVHEGWNLIGYTHWGTPTDVAWNGAACPTMGPCYGKLVSEYLGMPMMASVESMYRYDAARGFYVPVDEFTGEQRMLAGAGYWLALAEGTEGTINP